jgi:hypothetical protein
MILRTNFLAFLILAVWLTINNSSLALPSARVFQQKNFDDSYVYDLDEEKEHPSSNEADDEYLSVQTEENCVTYKQTIQTLHRLLVLYRQSQANNKFAYEFVEKCHLQIAYNEHEIFAFNVAYLKKYARYLMAHVSFDPNSLQHHYSTLEFKCQTEQYTIRLTRTDLAVVKFIFNELLDNDDLLDADCMEKGEIGAGKTKFSFASYFSVMNRTLFFALIGSILLLLLIAFLLQLNRVRKSSSKRTKSSTITTFSANNINPNNKTATIGRKPSDHNSSDAQERKKDELNEKSCVSNKKNNLAEKTRSLKQQRKSTTIENIAIKNNAQLLKASNNAETITRLRTSNNNVPKSSYFAHTDRMRYVDDWLKSIMHFKFIRIINLHAGGGVVSSTTTNPNNNEYENISKESHYDVNWYYKLDALEDKCYNDPKHSLNYCSCSSVEQDRHCFKNSNIDATIIKNFQSIEL